MKSIVPIAIAVLLPFFAAAQGLDDIIAGFDDPGSEDLNGTGNSQTTDLGEILTGFEKDEPAIEGVNGLEADKPLRFSGILNQRIVANIGGQAAPHDGMTSLRTQINLAADFQLTDEWRGHIDGHAFYDAAYTINGLDNYQPAFLDEYETELELGEFYLQGRLSSNFDLKLGRQIVVWGKSDAIRVTDLLNPLDMREPGLTELRDLRLPVTMAKLDYYFGDWNVSAIAIPEIRFNKMPVFGSDFYPAPDPAPMDDQPGEGFGNMEYAVALNGNFSGWDLSLIGASVYSDAPHAVSADAGLRRRHAQLSVVGGSVNVGVGNWLLKGEVAHLNGLRFLGAPDQDYSRLDVMLGFDYTGLSWATVSLEAANRHIQNFKPAIMDGPEDARENDFEAALQIRSSVMNDKLDLSAAISMHGLRGENGGFQRLEASYDLTDQAKLKLGAVNYVSGNKVFFQNLGDNDRLYAKFEYRF